MPEIRPAGGRREGPDAALEACRRIVRDEAFRAPPPGVPWRVGVEVEVLLVDPDTRRPVPPVADPEGPVGQLASAPLVDAWARPRGWVRHAGAQGLPEWRGPGGAVLSFEPGGQLEYASVPRHRLGELLDEIDTTLRSLAGHLEERGVEVVARGMDPETPLEEAPMHLSGERYRRQATHYDRRGRWGRRMMRQSAALHINVDYPDGDFEGWRLANALAPILVATFANSPRVAGQPSRWRSSRAAQWRRLDPTRSGVFGDDADPPAAYADRALDAEAFLLGAPGEPARPFREWVRSGGAGAGEWRAHLTTFFPEVRARGYMEVRSVDALPLVWLPVPVLLVAGLLRHRPSRQAALELLPPASEATLVRAAQAGVGDPGLRSCALQVMELAREGLRAHRPDPIPAPLIARLANFASEFTGRGRDPGHDDDDRFVRPGPTP